MVRLEYHTSYIIHLWKANLIKKKKPWLLHQNEYLRPFMYPYIVSGAQGEGGGGERGGSPKLLVTINEFT